MNLTGVHPERSRRDALGRLTSATTPEAGQVQFQYDNFDNLTQRTDARSVVTKYAYDGLNRLIGVAYTIPSGSGVQQAPSSSSPNTVCNPAGGTANSNVCFYYDQGGSSAYALGRLTEMVDPSGSETYSYNLLGEETQLQKVIGSTTYTTQYAYNLSGELTQATYPSGRVVQQSVDAIGRLCEIATSTTGCGTSSSPFATGYGYNTAMQLTGFN